MLVVAPREHEGSLTIVTGGIEIGAECGKAPIISVDPWAAARCIGLSPCIDIASKLAPKSISTLNNSSLPRSVAQCRGV